MVTEWKSGEVQWWRGNTGPNYSSETRGTSELLAETRFPVLFCGQLVRLMSSVFFSIGKVLAWYLQVKNGFSTLLRNCCKDVTSKREERRLHGCSLAGILRVLLLSSFHQNLVLTSTDILVCPRQSRTSQLQTTLLHEKTALTLSWTEPFKTPTC